MKHAFERVGISERDAWFNIEMARYINSGGTFAEMRALVDAAERMSGEGHVHPAHEGYSRPAQTRQPVEDGGAVRVEPQGRITFAPASSSNRGGEGHARYAEFGHSHSVLPVRELTPQQRQASRQVGQVVALTIMDTIRVDGRPIGDWTVAEARRAGKLKTREGHILLAATRTVANAAGHEKIREVVKPEEMQLIVQKAAEVSDAA